MKNECPICSHEVDVIQLIQSTTYKNKTIIIPAADPFVVCSWCQTEFNWIKYKDNKPFEYQIKNRSVF